jgi:hypothetical protein
VVECLPLKREAEFKARYRERKKKKKVIFNRHRKKIFDKTHHASMIKFLNKLGTEGKYLNTIKG